MSRWWSALIVILTIYIMYGIFGPLLDNQFTDMVSGLAVNWDNGQYANTITGNVTHNFWIGIVVLMFGMFFFMFIAGIPGQQEERVI